MAIKDSDREKIKKNKPKIALDFSRPLPSKPESSIVSFGNADELLKLTSDQNVKSPEKKVSFRQGAKKAFPSSISRSTKYALLDLIQNTKISHSDPHFQISSAEISKKLNVSKRTAQKYLRDWESSHLITNLGGADPGAKRPNKYRVNFEHLQNSSN